MARGIIPLLLLLALPGTTAANERMRFAPADIFDWETHSFNGTTEYSLAERDGEPAVHAHCEGGTGSGY